MTYEHHTPRHPEPIPYWRVADLALQRELGLRPQRRAKFGPLGLGRTVADWSDLTGCGKTLLARENLGGSNVYLRQYRPPELACAP